MKQQPALLKCKSIALQQEIRCYHVRPHLNASITRSFAGCWQFLTLTQCFDRPA